MRMLNPWRGAPSNNIEWSKGSMNGEGCDLSEPSPALAGYLGNVSCALFSPTVTCAKLLSKHLQIGFIGQTIVSQMTCKIIKNKEIFVKGESTEKLVMHQEW